MRHGFSGGACNFEHADAEKEELISIYLGRENPRGRVSASLVDSCVCGDHERRPPENNANAFLIVVCFIEW
jgi:hypothetical protein